MMEAKEGFFTQIRYFFSDYRRMSGSKKIRMLYLWMTRPVVGIFLYRFERSMFMLFGKYWQYMRILILPLLLLMNAYSNIEITYTASIGPGIKVLHPSMGIVINGKCRIGQNITMTGGNIIGGRRGTTNSNFILGEGIFLGGNASIIGPIIMGDHINVGAGAVVVKDAPDYCSLVGVPARIIEGGKLKDMDPS